MHNTPFGDINDSEDNLQPLVFAMTEEPIRALRLLGGVPPACEVNTVRMAERAHSDFLTVTELADTLVRLEGVSFRQAHQLVSAAVKDLQGRYSAAALINSTIMLAPKHLGRALNTDSNTLLGALDPHHFMKIRCIPGGPAPAVVEAALRENTDDVFQTSAWLDGGFSLRAEYPKRIRRACERLLAA